MKTRNAIELKMRPSDRERAENQKKTALACRLGISSSREIFGIVDTFKNKTLTFISSSSSSQMEHLSVLRSHVSAN